jgi:hypothetical protein
MYRINIDEIDTDGAVREAADAVAGDTRLDFLRKAGIAGGSILAGGALLGAIAPAAMAAGNPPKSFGAGDVGILNYALTLEYLESAFYNQATAGGKITSAQLKIFLRTTTNDEREHVAYLKKALGSKAVKSPKFDFKGVPTNEKMFAATAQVLENTGVHAYLGQVGNIKSPSILGAAGSIMTVEARHAGAIGVINNAAGGISPSGPFDSTLSAADVLKAVAGTGFIVS